jgi:hypothetical protein
LIYRSSATFTEHQPGRDPNVTDPG